MQQFVKICVLLFDKKSRSTFMVCGSRIFTAKGALLVGEKLMKR